MNRHSPVPLAQLLRRCDPQQFAFETTAEVEDSNEIIGQPRALEAIQLAVGIQQEGFNLFALGRNGLGKQTAVDQFLRQKAASESVSDDWCYVYNFDVPHKPHAIQLPAGRAAGFRDEMERLVAALQVVVPAAFASEEYRDKKKNIKEELQEEQAAALESLRKEASSRNIAVIQTPSGFALAPMRDGEILSPEEFGRLPSQDRKQIEQDVADLQQNLESIMREIPRWQREIQIRTKELDEEVASAAVSPLFDDLSQRFESFERVLKYLGRVRQDVIENVSRFLEQERAPQVSGQPSLAQMGESPLSRYQVNLVVDQTGSVGAPVVYEDQPTYANLIGRVEHISQMGTLLTDFTLIKPGALHLANGGYLILDARNLLLQPYAWEGLKQALRAHQIRIESLGRLAAYVSTVSLEPEPIPLAVKIILLGERHLYYLLHRHDPDFSELFKVAADFEEDMERNPDNVQAYAQLIGTLARKENLRHFDRMAVARVVEHSSRIAHDAEKLSTHMQSISDLLRESSFWAGQEDREVVSLPDVRRALQAQKYRAGRVSEKIKEAMIRETLFIDTHGSVVGQINGLAVYSQGDFAFGKASRITARVRMGKGEVVDIERQVEMGGPLHSKGVLILAGYLGSRYASERPLSLSASLVFEQSYSGVDGDSASSAELYALLSALSAIPIDQSFAVTGSVNQLGQVQAIGGVNEKVEGFFELCSERGLTGQQGVLIPAANVKHLMLAEPVLRAVEEGKFKVFAVNHVDEGIEILTGVSAGKRDEQGSFPADSLNGRIVERLETLAKKQRAYSARNGSADSNENAG